ncbi:MAG: NAD(P)H-hydrate dehydratase [Bacteroidales bacterium]|nr:NAD(P)H-hydrate dehydratase [Bacteroidales bacterium]
MKILTAAQIRQADQYTIQNEPIASIDLMERAALKCTDWILQHLNNFQTVQIYCGNGNNGGDGLAIARLLTEKKITVEVVLVMDSQKGSPDFLKNRKRLEKYPDIRIHNATENGFPSIPDKCLLIDAIFGSGLNRAPEGLAAEAIQLINQSKRIVIAIDIPSGLPVDETATDPQKVIKADYTLCFAPIKIALIHPENENFCGEWHLIDIGHHPVFMEEVTVSQFFISPQMVRSLIPKRRKFSHKGTFGHALLLAGSRGKSGAATMAAMACHRSGCGLLTIHTPPSVLHSIECHSPETMVSIDSTETYISSLPKLDNYTAVAMGPGIGTMKETANTLKLLLQQWKGPLVLDADALNILSENKTWMAFLPPDCILTPHPREFARMAGKSVDSFEQKEKQRELSIRYGVFIILKGAHTCISTPTGQLFFNSSGNPGMAAAGSGDVLTGILLGLLSSGYTPAAASIAAVYLHGLAGDIAMQEHGQEALIATSIIQSIGKAFLKCISECE